MAEGYKSSAFAGGNLIAQDRIELHKNYPTYVKGGLFKSKEVQINYHDIDDVQLNTPLVGFSSIKFYAPISILPIEVGYASVNHAETSMHTAYGRES